jgi:hypothetical protein
MNNKKIYGIIAFIALIMISMVFVSCGQKISGTFSYEDDPDDFFITFKGNNFVGKWEGYNIAGTFSIVDDKIFLDIEGDSFVIKIIDKDTLEDPEGDYWKRRK